MFQVAVIGASGFTGAEFLRLCATHPELEVKVATANTHAGKPIASVYPHLAAHYGDMRFDHYSPEIVESCDLVFMALPHGQSQILVPELRGRTKHMVDLAADFRFNDSSTYADWYGEDHQQPGLMGEFRYGLPELFRDDLGGAELVAVAGCYVTTSTLALAPLVKAGVIEPTNIVVDAASGVSGAGRAPKDSNSFTTVDENFTAYGLINHRHTPEIEMAVSSFAGTDVGLVFTPHLAPMNRGILATCYGRSTGDLDSVDVLQTLEDAYAGEPFIVVSERSPSTKSTLGSNSVHMTARVDPRTGWVIVIAALDNLVKGASGQGIQCANLALGIPEASGLPTVGVYP